MAKPNPNTTAQSTEVKEPEGFNPTVTKDMPDFDKWSDEQVSFAPYWKPAIGKWFFGAPIAIDMRDPQFVRFQFIAGADTPCQRGPADEDDPNAEKVLVKKGELFSLSVFYALKDVFMEYLRFSETKGQPVFVRVDALRTVKTANQPKCWQFRARVSPEQKKMLTEWRLKNTKFLPVPKDVERPAIES